MLTLFTFSITFDFSPFFFARCFFLSDAPTLCFFFPCETCKRKNRKRLEELGGEIGNNERKKRERSEKKERKNSSLFLLLKMKKSEHFLFEFQFFCFANLLLLH